MNQRYLMYGVLAKDRRRRRSERRPSMGVCLATGLQRTRYAYSFNGRRQLHYSERSAWTVLIRAARTAGTNDAKIAEATMTAADPINGSSPGSWSAGT